MRSRSSSCRSLSPTPRCGDHLRQVADPRAQAVMPFHIHRNHSRAYRLQQCNVLSLPFRVRLIGADWRDQPHRVAKQIGIRVLDSTVFLAGHGVSGKHADSRLRAEYQARAFNEPYLRAAGIGNQRARGKRGGELFEGGKYAANRCGKNHDITALGRLARVSLAAIDCATDDGSFQHLGPVAANQGPRESLLAQRKSERAADQARSYDRDLPNRHGRPTLSFALPPEQSSATAPSVQKTVADTATARHRTAPRRVKDALRSARHRPRRQPRRTP